MINEIENCIIFEIELCFINLADYICEKGPLKNNLCLFYDILIGVTQAL